jgi:hypothetical protein
LVKAQELVDLRWGEAVNVTVHGVAMKSTSVPYGIGIHPLNRSVNQARMIVGARAGGGPEEVAVFGGNGAIVNAGFAAAHQAIFGKFPVFIAVGTIPLSSIVMPFVLKIGEDPEDDRISGPSNPETNSATQHRHLPVSVYTPEFPQTVFPRLQWKD